MNPASGPSRNAAREATSSTVPARRAGDDSRISRNAGPPGRVQLGLREWRHDDAGADGVCTSALFSPLDGDPLDTQVIGPFGELVCPHRVGNVFRRQERQVQQLVGRNGGERLLLCRLQGRLPIAGHAGYDDGRATVGNHAAELLEDERRAIQVDLQDGFGGCHRGRESGGLDDLDDLAQRLRGPDERPHRVARGHVNGLGCHAVAQTRQFVRRGLQRAFVEVRQQYGLARSLAASDRQPDTSGTDHNDNVIIHESLLLVVRLGEVTSASGRGHGVDRGKTVERAGIADERQQLSDDAAFRVET